MDKPRHKFKVVSPPPKKRRKKKSTSSSTESTKPVVTSTSAGPPKKPKKKVKRSPAVSSSSAKVTPQKITPQKVRTKSTSPNENQWHLLIFLLGEYPRCETYSNEEQVRNAIKEVTEGRALLDVRLFLFYGKQLGFKAKVLDKPNIIVQRTDGGDMVITNNPKGSMLNNTGELVTLPESVRNAAVKSADKDTSSEDDLGFSW